ncbi:hypothetical protein AXW67_17430 [Bradyrhizobium neotropicale]|uniref:Schlafen AlbA-2 domain-containing protein n=2 Tax=Bradyrhizobium neotropicale TaxID=1497615 RepID=A0A176Z528_9BRAD|nr:hypothetical protein AXW67_17430 [Bradyrhizobium neotropicale]
MHRAAEQVERGLTFQLGLQKGSQSDGRDACGSVHESLVRRSRTRHTEERVDALRTPSPIRWFTRYIDETTAAGRQPGASNRRRILETRMILKQIDKIELADLERLLGVARESKTLEFKQMMPAKSEKEVIQFLAAVSAFANSAGGDLLIGIMAEDGVATAISGVPLAGFDDEKLRLEQLLADNIEPRLPLVTFHSVPCGDENHVLMVRAQRSWLSPHRVTKNDKFYGRNSAGKYPLDVGELRNAFVLREGISDRIREFRRDRLAKIASGSTPCRLSPSTSIVLHVIPIPSFGDRRLINVAEELAARPVTLPVPLGSRGAGHGVNLDGLFLYSGSSMAESHGYGLLFRDGAIEGVKQLSVLDDGRPYIAGSVFEQDVIETLKIYMKTCEQLETSYAGSWVMTA